MKGVLEKNGIFYCAECGKKMEKIEGNFCAICGNPLNDLAIKLVKERNRSIKLQTLGELTSKTNDADTLNLLFDEINNISN